MNAPGTGPVRHTGAMAIPPQSAAILQKAALLDLVLGVAMAAYGLVADSPLFLVLGAAVGVAGLGMLTVIRAQRADPDGPIS